VTLQDINIHCTISSVKAAGFIAHFCTIICTSFVLLLQAALMMVTAVTETCGEE
jgi:hypothetical protein